MDTRVTFLVDNREHELIKRLESKNAKFQVQQLDLGDIVFRDQNGEDIMVIERKSVQDLKASITDGRAREQKARLLATTSKTRVLYLVEGNLNVGLTDKIQNMPVSTLIGSMINTMLRDGVKVYKTSSMEETTNFLIKLHDKLESDLDKYFNEEDHQITPAEYSATLKKRKKANMTPQVWFLAQLALIPQVTEKIAEKILETYPTVSALMKGYSLLSSDNLREKMLADITYPLSTGKTRRIGDKVSKRIFQFMYGLSDDLDEVSEQFSSVNIK